MVTASTGSWKDDLNRSSVRSAMMIGNPNSSANVVRRTSLHVLEGQAHSPYHTVQALYQITVCSWHFFHITATSHTLLKLLTTSSHGSNHFRTAPMLTRTLHVFRNHAPQQQLVSMVGRYQMHDQC